MEKAGFCLVRTLLFSMILLMAASTSYGAEATEKTLNSLQGELRKKGMSVSDVAEIKEPAKEMLKKGATKDELREVLLNLSKSGVKGADLRYTMDSMNGLIKSGKSPREAGNIVSRAAHQAQAEGLKGTALANRVHQAIKEMQAEKKESRQIKEEQKEIKVHQSNIKEHTERGSREEGFRGEGMEEHGMGSMGGAGHGRGR